MASVQDQDVLRNMIMCFRVNELQLLLGFAGKYRNGKKHELQERALKLVKLRSTPMRAKIRELYRSLLENNPELSLNSISSTESAIKNMNPYSGLSYPALLGLNYGQQAAAAAAAAAVAAGGLQGRNHYGSGAAAGYPTGTQQIPQAAPQQQQLGLSHPSAAAAPPHPNAYSTPYQIAPSRSVMPVHPDVRIVNLPFYEVRAELLRPASLLPQGGNRFHEAQFQFFLTPSQATDIAANRDIQVGSKMDYLYQIQLRFGPLDNSSNKEVSDEFPPSVNVHVNGKMVQLPNPIPTNKQGVEPKRPPKPVNITPLCKLSPILPNVVGVKWAAEYGKGWICCISLVLKLTSADLLDRLKQRGTRDAKFTRNLIVDKLNDNDADVALTSLKVSVTCPLGKMRMKVPCRSISCDHLQCFDASTFLQMNERKPTWNCPVCDKKAIYDNLVIDGYFQEVIDSKDTVNETEVILEKDGSWRPVPKDKTDDGKDASNRGTSSPAPQQHIKRAEGDNGDEGVGTTSVSNGGQQTTGSTNTVPDCIDLSDDDDNINIPVPPSQPPLPPPPLPPPPPPNAPPPPLPPLPDREIECIDLD